MNAPAFGKAHRKKTTPVFVVTPTLEAGNYLAVTRPKKTIGSFQRVGGLPSRNCDRPLPASTAR